MSEAKHGEPSNIEPGAFEALVRAHMGLGDRFRFSVIELRRGYASLRLEYDDTFIRPGGTISGPTMFTLSDLALYAAVMSEIGEVAQAVTTDLTIHFLKRPEPGPLLGDARLLQVGSKLIIGQVEIFDEARQARYAHAVGTYAVPKRRR